MTAEARNRLIDDVLAAVRAVHFPASKEEVVETAGFERVKMAEDKTMTLREALEPVSDERFRSRDDLLDSLSRAHDLDWTR